MKTRKPEFKQRTSLNYLEAVNYITEKYQFLTENEAWDQHKDFDMSHQRCLWLWLIDSDYVSNDVYVTIDFATWFEETQDDVFDELRDIHALEFMKHLVDEFDLRNHRDVLWEISW